MPEISITDLFGANATQTATELIIVKADLVPVGLTPAANNSGESLLAGIVKRAQTVLTPANFDTNPDQSITIENGFPDLPQRGEITVRRNPKTINFYKPDADSEIDPDDY